MSKHPHFELFIRSIIRTYFVSVGVSGYLRLLRPDSSSGTKEVLLSSSINLSSQLVLVGFQRELWFLNIPSRTLPPAFCSLEMNVNAEQYTSFTPPGRSVNGNDIGSSVTRDWVVALTRLGFEGSGCHCRQMSVTLHVSRHASDGS